MRKSASNRSLIKAKPQTKPSQPAVLLKQPPNPPLQNQLTQSIGIKLQ